MKYFINIVNPKDNLIFEMLLEKSIVRKCPYGLKVLGGGEIKTSLAIVADEFSESARTKIEAAGGHCRKRD